MRLKTYVWCVTRLESHKGTKGPDHTPMKSVDGALILNNVNKSDTGVYQCRASNGIGSDAMVSSVVTVNCKFHMQGVTEI